MGEKKLRNSKKQKNYGYLYQRFEEKFGKYGKLS